MKNILYLASQSQSRQLLLKESRIPFTLLTQTADEQACDWNMPLDQLVASIARHKMAHAQLPVGSEGDTIFVVTADTLSQDLDGTINGKPENRADAIAKIKRARQGSRLSTAFCLERKIFKKGIWQTERSIEQVVSATYVFAIPDEWIEHYLENSIALSCANAIAIEQYGMQFLKELQGSYSAIVGLPMFELRQALEELGFFSER